MIIIQAKSKTGQVVEFEVDRILSIDGQPYTATAGDLRDLLVHLEGRVSAVENILTTQPLVGV